MSMSDDVKQSKAASWAFRVLAALGFVLAVTAVVMIVSRQVAIDRARGYLRQRYNVNVEVPVRDVRPEFIQGPLASGRALPPFGFCWTVEIEGGLVSADGTINPWTHEVVEWRVDL